MLVSSSKPCQGQEQDLLHTLEKLGYERRGGDGGTSYERRGGDGGVGYERGKGGGIGYDGGRGGGIGYDGGRGGGGRGDSELGSRLRIGEGISTPYARIKTIIISSPLSRFSLATVVLSPVTVSSVHDWKPVDSGSRFKAMKTPTHGGVEKPKVIFFPLIGSKRSRWSHDLR
ncbi:hypothetical protein Lal_00042415 [Lupinus albus]|nr:hypothetical protein Lal_00042415 [Lupinus albus]